MYLTVGCLPRVFETGNSRPASVKRVKEGSREEGRGGEEREEEGKEERRREGEGQEGGVKGV